MLSNIFDEYLDKLEKPYYTFDDLKIRTKDKTLVTFSFNSMQIALCEKIGYPTDGSFKEIENLSLLLLKGRQMGCTTFFAGLLFLQTINIPHSSTLLVTQSEEDSSKLFSMITRFYDNLPNPKPKLKYSTKKEMVFEELDSVIVVGTAGKKTLGRSQTINNVLLTEMAHYPSEGEDAIIGLLGAMPPGSNIIKESTANGVGNSFHSEWEDSSLDAIKIFFPWFMAKEYVRDSEELIGLSEENARYKELHHLTESQMAWKVHQHRLFKDKFPQEFPATPNEAFIVSGNTFFDTEIIDDYINTSKNAPTLPIPEAWSKVRQYKKGVSLFELPRPDHRYIITADTSEGEISKVKSDNSSVDVIDLETFDQVFHLNDKIPPHELAYVLEELHKIYNRGLIIVERNNHGHTTLSTLTNILKVEPMSINKWGGVYLHREWDASLRQFSAKPGFPTSVKTKPMALDALKELTDERSLGIRASITLNQMRYYQRLGNNRYGAPNGLHDDSVMSLAIGCYVLKDPPKVKTIRKNVHKKRGGYL